MKWKKELKFSSNLHKYAYIRNKVICILICAISPNCDQLPLLVNLS